MELKKYFDKKYQDDVAYMKQKEAIKRYLKMHNESESVDIKVLRIPDLNEKVSFHIWTGKFYGTADI